MRVHAWNSAHYLTFPFVLYIYMYLGRCYDKNSICPPTKCLKFVTICELILCQRALSIHNRAAMLQYIYIQCLQIELNGIRRHHHSF
jgi:hypothetical protein